MKTSDFFFTFRNNDTGNELGAPMWQNKLEQNPAMKFFLSWSQFCTCSVPGFLGLNEKKKAEILTSLFGMTKLI